MPAGQTIARGELIVAALNTFTDERVAGTTALCSAREWVDASLRDAGFPVLRADEVESLGLDTY